MRSLGERAIPALFQRFDRDDKVNWAVGVEQVDPVEFTLIASCNRNAMLFDPLTGQ